MSAEGIYECVWLLRPEKVRECGYAQRGPGMCPFDHGEDVALVPLREVERLRKVEAAAKVASSNPIRQDYPMQGYVVAVEKLDALRAALSESES